MDSLIAIFAETLSVDAASLDDDSSPDNISQWDSVNAMHLVDAIEQAFSIKLSTAEIMSMSTIGLARSVLRKKGLAGV